jgi:hypothetical protein
VLRNLTTGRAKPFALSRAAREPFACGQSTCDESEPIAMGAHWLAVREPGPETTDGVTRTFYRFQNLRTGAVRTDPSSAHTAVELGLPTLARPPTTGGNSS